MDEFASIKPAAWGENLAGVKTRIKTNEKVLALTFDACDAGYDAKLINCLIKEKVPATLFITGDWIDKFPNEFDSLSANSLFEIENQGLKLKPAGVSGQIIYEIQSSTNVADFEAQVAENALKISLLTGRFPKFFRPATAYYDDVAVKITKKLGYEPVGYSINGEPDGNCKKSDIIKQLISVPNGSIVLMHMNHPETETAEGVIASIPFLKKMGYRFVRLQDYSLE